MSNCASSSSHFASCPSVSLNLINQAKLLWHMDPCINWGTCRIIKQPVSAMCGLCHKDSWDGVTWGLLFTVNWNNNTGRGSQENAVSGWYEGFLFLEKSVQACRCVHVCTHTCTHACMHARAHTHTCAHTCTHACTHACMLAHTRTHTQVLFHYHRLSESTYYQVSLHGSKDVYWCTGVLWGPSWKS